MAKFLSSLKLMPTVFFHIAVISTMTIKFLVSYTVTLLQRLVCNLHFEILFKMN